MSSSHRTKEQKAASLEKFYTHPALALACVQRLKADGLLPTGLVRAIDPCAGAGAWIRAMLLQPGIDERLVFANDIDGEAMSRIVGIPAKNVWIRNALDLERAQWDLVLGNPPFNEADAHIAACRAMRTDKGVLGLILRDGHFAASKRLGFWEECRPTKLYLLSPRPPFKSKGGNTDSATYVFAVWSRPWEIARATLPGVWETTVDVLNWAVCREEEAAASSKPATKRRRKKEIKCDEEATV